MNDERPDYFAAAPSEEVSVLRGIKGNFRRQMIQSSLMAEPLTSIPEMWRAHNITEELKGFLTSRRGPQGRGAGRIPDLGQGEAQIARLSLVNSVHGEVTNLRESATQRIRVSCYQWLMSMRPSLSCQSPKCLLP